MATRVSIVIDGDSADELHAVGVRDLLAFLPAALKVSIADIKQVQISGGSILDGSRWWDGCSFYRDEAKLQTDAN